MTNTDTVRVDERQAALLRAHVAEIERSSALGGTNRAGKLLRFLIEEEIAGRGHYLNAYSVGVDGLGRPESFDPATDSSLRVAMHSVRATLATFYAARPQSPVVISFPRASYCPKFQFAEGWQRDFTIGEDGPVERTDLASFLRRHWRAGAVLAFALLILVGTAYRFQQGVRMDRCEDARPTLGVAVGPAQTQAQLRASLEEYLNYYPILELTANGSPVCHGIPAYTLALDEVSPGDARAGAGAEYRVRLVEPAHRDLIWTKKYRLGSNPYYTPLETMAAQVAYDIGNGTGVIASNASAYRWENTSAEEAFDCLVQIHRYFAAGDATELPSATQCASRYWRTSRHADLVALFAALEYDVAENSNVSPGEKRVHRQLMDAALQRAESLSANDKEVLTMKLRIGRNQPIMNIGSVTATMAAIDRYLPREPHALNQNAITSAAYLGNFREGYDYSRRASALSGNDPAIYDGEMYYYLVNGDWEELSQFGDRLASWEFPGEQILALCVARKTDKPAIEERAVQILARNNLRTHAEIIKAVDDQFPPGRIADSVRSCLS